VRGWPCCCGDGAPCVGDSCCVSCEDDNCCVIADQYVVDFGTVSCDCWTWGDYEVSAPGKRWCAESGSPTCPDDYVEINDCPWQWKLKNDVCDAGPYIQHVLAQCNESGVACPDSTRNDYSWNWPTGTVTAQFPMDLVANPLDPTGQCGVVLPNESGTITYTSYTGAPNAAANNAVVCYPYPATDPDDPFTGTPPYAGAVMVQAGFKACQPHPCAEWAPNEFTVEQMCEPCTERWDILTVAYFIRNEHQVQSNRGADGWCDDGAPNAECWTYDTWTALVRYVRKPVCPESGARSIVGTYQFACAEVYLPTTSVFAHIGVLGELQHHGGRGRRLIVTNAGVPCVEATCTWDVPDPICPTDIYTSGNKAKICGPVVSGYGWTFPSTVTINYAP